MNSTSARVRFNARSYGLASGEEMGTTVIVNEAEERGTTIIFNEGESVAMVWSASPVFQRKMASLGVDPYRQEARAKGKREEKSYWYMVPKRWVKISPPRRSSPLAPEQRKQLAERMRAWSAGKEGKPS